MLQGKKILLIISGGIAAYKALELIRLLKKNNAQINCILTKAGEQFVTPLSVASLSGEKVYTDLWSLTDETEMGHIRLSRENDLILIAPASADILAKMAHGLANDLASATLLASNRPIMAAPSMNQMMWENPATKNNIATLKSRGVSILEPSIGEMACGENGLGRLPEPDEILSAVKKFFFDQPLKGLKALVTSGPTFEPIDPVRFIGNHSSGKQGHAIAAALQHAGATVTLVSGPVTIPDPADIKTIHVQDAYSMLEKCKDELPCDIAIFAAAVSDWRPLTTHKQKLKKNNTKTPPILELQETTDILKTISTHKTQRPKLVVGFAAETENIENNAKNKLASKGCDWIVANKVGNNIGFGTDDNTITLISKEAIQSWETMSKKQVAQRLVEKIILHFKA